ncbi:three component ABC system middle component, partial [Streptomyces sp. NPDC058171]
MTFSTAVGEVPASRVPMEERSLFNPAFIAVLLHRAVRSWGHERHDGMHVILSFLIIPVVLHSPTRASLPRTKKASMLEWIHSHPDS